MTFWSTKQCILHRKINALTDTYTDINICEKPNSTNTLSPWIYQFLSSVMQAHEN